MGGCWPRRLCLSLSQFIWPFGKWYSDDTVLAGRWNQLAGEWYDLYETEGHLDNAELRKQVAALGREAIRIENEEDASRFSPSQMTQAEADEKAYQGFANPNAKAHALK